MLEAAQTFVDAARETSGEETVTLLRRYRYRGFLGGSAPARVRDHVVFEFKELLRVLQFVSFLQVMLHP